MAAVSFLLIRNFTAFQGELQPGESVPPPDSEVMRGWLRGSRRSPSLQTVTMPMMGTVNLQGDCWYDFIDKKIRQDGEMSSPFGTSESHLTSCLFSTLA